MSWQNAFWALLACLLLGGVFHGCNQQQTEKISNVITIMMHEPGNYSIYCRQADKLVRRGVHCNFTEPEIFLDVPEGEACWASVTSSTFHTKKVEFHLHSEKEIEGGGWNHGKGGKGQTTRLL